MSQNSHDHKRGKIKDNALKALVTSPLFRTRVEKKKKGKGSFQRNAKHRKQFDGGGKWNDLNHSIFYFKDKLSIHFTF